MGGAIYLTISGTAVVDYLGTGCRDVSDAATAVQRITVFIKEMNSRLSASRLRLNSAKTEVMWLGSGQQINQVDISDILILSSSVKVVESARDLGVIRQSVVAVVQHGR